MSPLQNLWLTIFNFSPAIILGIYKQLWVGIIAFIAGYILSWLLLFAVTINIPYKAMTVWSWIKPPIVALSILALGWNLF